jgi:hypothetical protein
MRRSRDWGRREAGCTRGASDRLAVRARAWFGASGLRARAAAARRWLDSNRNSLFVFSLTIFVAGMAWSISELHLDPARIDLVAVAVLLLLFGPGTVIYAAVGLTISAQAVGTRMPFRRAFRFAAAAGLAEALPVPGGALVRGAALVRSGASMAGSAWIVMLAAILWVALAAMAAAAGLMAHGSPAAPAVGLSGTAGAALCIIWIARRASLRCAMVMTFHRLVGLAISLARIIIAFLAVGLVVDPAASAVFTFASILGTASSIAPAGLGISEALAAAMAGAVAIDPAYAFLAVGLNRILALAANAVIAWLCLVAVNRTGHVGAPQKLLPGEQF